MFKERVLTYLKVLPWNYKDGAEKPHETVTIFCQDWKPL